LDNVSTAGSINFGLFTLCIGLAIPLVITFAAQVLATERNLFLLSIVGPITVATILGALFFGANWRQDQKVRGSAIDRIKKSARRAE